MTYREEGNADFRQGKYLKAAVLYTKALEETVQAKDRAALYSNRSLAFLKVNKVSKAIEDAKQCISLAPEWDKAYFRLGAALEARGDIQEAVNAYEKCACLSAATKESSGQDAGKAKEKVRLLKKLIRNESSCSSS
jgi:tetratricopeptide (TPR) repeat protein